MPRGFAVSIVLMKNSLRSMAAAVVITLISAAVPSHAATVNDFYKSLLKRGVEHVNSGNFEAAASELKLASFGLLDSIPLYETAQIYLTIAAQHLGREPQARAAATHVVAADRIEAHYAKLDLPEKTRKEFETIAQKMLTDVQWKMLEKP